MHHPHPGKRSSSGSRPADACCLLLLLLPLLLSGWYAWCGRCKGGRALATNRQPQPPPPPAHPLQRGFTAEKDAPRLVQEVVARATVQMVRALQPKVSGVVHVC